MKAENKLDSKKAKSEVGKETKRITAKAAPKRLTSKPAAKQIASKLPAKCLTSSEPAKKIATTTQKRLLQDTSAKKPSKVSNRYEMLDIDTCLQYMHQMGVTLSYQELCVKLLIEADAAVVAKELMKQFGIKKTAFTLKNNGFNTDIILEALKKIVQSMPFTAQDYPLIEKQIQQTMHYSFQVDNDLENADAYLLTFHTMEQILMIGQKLQVHQSKEIATLLHGTQLEKAFPVFFDLAHKVLGKFQYRDVEYYENFVYALCSQFDDIYQQYEQALQLDIADLYIQHCDYQRGDVNYGYLLRENGIRDMIYYRFVKIYEDKDLNKAKGIAYEATRFTLESSPYYAYIQEILAT